MKHLINQLVTSITNISQRQITVSYFNPPTLQQCSCWVYFGYYFCSLCRCTQHSCSQIRDKGLQRLYLFTHKHMRARTYEIYLEQLVTASLKRHPTLNTIWFSIPKNIAINAVINFYSVQHEIKQFPSVKEW